MTDAKNTIVLENNAVPDNSKETYVHGTYANQVGSKVYYNPVTNNVVVFDANNNFVTGFKIDINSMPYRNYINNGFLK